MANISQKSYRTVLFGSALVVLTACEQPLDFDLRSLGDGFSTADAARNATLDRPATDNRGVISYPNYQVAVASRGDTIADIATRVGLPADELAKYNGIPRNAVLRQNEVIALPRRVAEPSPATGAVTTGPLQPGSNIDIGSIAGPAIDRAGTQATSASAAQKQTGTEPIRHKVERGETAYSVSRLYNVSARSLADWNGLGTDLAIREGQYLLIPVVADVRAAAAPTTPGQGTLTPIPPSSTTALPAEKPTVPKAPASPDLGNARTASQDSSKLLMPVAGKIIRPYVKGKNDGVDIAASAGTAVNAAADGEVAAITRDTDQVPILVLRHANNVLTVYAGVDKLTVKKGDKVKRGQKIAVVRDAQPSFLHFEVRKGLDSVDPVSQVN